MPMQPCSYFHIPSLQNSNLIVTLKYFTFSCRCVFLPSLTLFGVLHSEIFRRGHLLSKLKQGVGWVNTQHSWLSGLTLNTCPMYNTYTHTRVQSSWVMGTRRCAHTVFILHCFLFECVLLTGLLMASLFPRLGAAQSDLIQVVPGGQEVPGAKRWVPELVLSAPPPPNHVDSFWQSFSWTWKCTHFKKYKLGFLWALPEEKFVIFTPMDDVSETAWQTHEHVMSFFLMQHMSTSAGL